MHRIALGSIFTECNQLGGVPIDITWFERSDFHRGEDVLKVSSGAVGGMLQALREYHADAAPLLYASTCPGGSLTAACYTQLKMELLDRLHGALPVDGILLSLHGAAAAENAPDLEGDLIGAVRQLVGPKVPIVATLDLHANVTADMVRFADALIAWATYPHRDTFTTGVRGARMVLDIVTGRDRPMMAMAKVPVLTGGIRCSTEGDDPFAHLMRLTKSHEGRDGVLSTSLFIVHPYLDQPGMGSGPLVITDNDMEKAVGIARRIAEQLWARRLEFEPELSTPDEAITRGLKVDGPVLLVESADNCGGGAAGDSVASLKALLRAHVAQISLVPVVDPGAAAACHRVGVGGTVTVALGHQCDPRWGQPVTVTGRVTRLSDGRFRYVGGIWDNIEGNMGPSVVLTIGAIQVLVASHATYDWMDEQYRSLQLNPRQVRRR
jgi:microcystin degradation protein MlrC